MVSRDRDRRRVEEPANSVNYPLKGATSDLNDRLGLYLSEEQQRGFARGLLIGTALGAALLAWNLMMLIRRNS